MPEPTTRLEPTRVREFAHFFKRYMSISAIVAAALPIPVTAFGLIPVYSAQKPYLSTYTSLFCFLFLGFLFFSRHALARRLFPHLFPRLVGYGEAGSPAPQGGLYRLVRSLTSVWAGYRRVLVPALPLILIFLAFGFMLSYHYYLNHSVSVVMERTNADAARILKEVSFNEIPDDTMLTLTYLGIFIMAEAAFIVMAIKEYVQDLLGITEIQILTRYEARDQEGLRELLGGEGGERTTGWEATDDSQGEPHG